MKNSFIIKNADTSFELYYANMRKRKANLGQSVLSETMGNRVKGKRPGARDGHTGVVYGEEMLVFGGDRHHMPFNDMFTLDLMKEFII